MRCVLKLNPWLFEALRDGRRRFDVRPAGVVEGDLIRYEEHDFVVGDDTGRWLEFTVSHVVRAGTVSIVSLLLARAPRDLDAALAAVPAEACVGITAA